MTHRPAEDRAAEAARSSLGLPSNEPFRAFRVRRLRPEVDDYFLVVFGADERATGVAAVDCGTFDVRESARLPGLAPHSILSAGEARAIAGLPETGTGELVWEPSAASRSPFHPLWRFDRPGGVIWIDAVRGVAFDSLDPPGRRGG